MTIDLKLDPTLIRQLIERLEFFKEHIGEELVNILCIEGAMVANSSFGGMASADGGVVEAGEGNVTGKIIANAKNEDVLLIAEFGAGDATIMPSAEFEDPEVEGIVYPGAYSLLHKREYYDYGSWKYGGKWYTEVPAKHGMFDAKLYIQQNYARIAEEVIRLD